MKREEIYIGQKVVPISKTGIFASSMDRYLHPSNATPTSKFLKANEYVVVKGFENEQVILGDGTIFSGDYFLPQDLIPYKIKKENNKMEKKMTKADLEGKWFKIKKSKGNAYYKTGDIIQCKNSGLTSLQNVDTLSMWHHNLNKEFTLAELTKVLKTYYAGIGLEIVYLGDEPNQTSKNSKLSDITVKIKADLVFDSPVIEESKEEVFIFSGRNIIYIQKTFGQFAIATLNSKELNLYNKEIGMSLAFKRCWDKISKGEK